MNRAHICFPPVLHSPFLHAARLECLRRLCKATGKQNRAVLPPTQLNTRLHQLKGGAEICPQLVCTCLVHPTCTVQQGSLHSGDLSLLKCSQRCGGQPRSTGRPGASKAPWKVHRLHHFATMIHTVGITLYISTLLSTSMAN